MNTMNKNKILFKSFSGFAITGAEKKGDMIIMGYQFNVDDGHSELSKLVMVQHILDDFVYPEVINRVKGESNRPSFPLRFAHVMMSSNETKNRIFLNEEVKIKARVKLTREFKPGEEVRLGNIKEILSLYPLEKVDKNTANILLVKHKGKWYFFADLIFDREKVGQRFELSHDFFKLANTAYRGQNWGPFIDTLYSVTELSIQSILLLTFYERYSLKQSHQKTMELFEGLCKTGNFDLKFFKHYKLLYSLRKKARYLNKTQGKKFVLQKNKGKEFLKTTKELMNTTDLWLKRIDLFKKHKDGHYIALGP